ncbi:hypothetical protein LEQ06_17795 [Paraclostridium sp. AKS46]|nr:hypothetical protein [Paraclostridium sp. AKS46]
MVYVSKGTIKGFSSVFWSGITTLELSKAIDKALDTNIEGIYNITPGYKISKYDLLNIIKDEFKKDDIIIEKNNTIVCDKSLVTIKKDFDYKAPSYEEMVKEMKTWMQENRDLYKIYN